MTRDRGRGRPALGGGTAAAPEPGGPGSIARLDAMWVHHRDSVWRVLLSLTRDLDLADDLLQDTYLRAREGAGALRGGDARPWLVAIARNVYFSHARRRSSSELALALEAAEEQPRVDLVELLAIRQALADLPALLRSALVMKHYAGYSYQEIAGRQQCAVGTAKWRVSRALDRLRRVLAERRAEMESAEAHGIALVDYVYGMLSPDGAATARAHLAQCQSCRREGEELEQVVSALDALEGDRRQMHFVEISESGAMTVYCTGSVINDTGRPLESSEFQTNTDVGTRRLYQDGEEVAFAVAPAPEFGEHMFEYTFPLPRPIAPGGRLSLLVAWHCPVGHPLSPKRSDDGQFRLDYTQGPSSTYDYAYVQAIRLPAGAALLSVEPKPDETRAGGALTLVWRQLVPAGRFFRCTLNYRFGESPCQPQTPRSK